MAENIKYIEEKNSDELSQKFHEKAGNISRDLNRQLLSLSTGIIGAFFILAFNEKHLHIFIKVCIIISIICFGLTIYFIISGMQSDSSKNYFLANINDSTKQDKREENIELKKKFNDKQLDAKKKSRLSFISGVICSIILLIIHLFS
ncbi:hypothetical protein [Flavobacterium sp. UBA7680]|uniref:hypothetical protein n=1 Tax=Flavobacterium sp. UBA7680 TaxID=1946559 RepID=UPI0025C28A7C|nr:hypothetical protein [Flavobacterium sp. UBA7680]